MLDILTVHVTPFVQNCRILAHQETNDAVIVDPGGTVSVIIDTIQAQELKPKAILLTHGHLDHVGATASLIKKFPDIKVYGPHKDDLFLLNTLENQARMFGLACDGSFNPEFVTDGQELKLFNDASLQVIHTPGHTPGGVCFYCKEENFVLTGDTLFLESIGRADFEGGNFADLIDSIKTKLLVLPDNTDVMPGHGEDSTIAHEKLNNPFVQ